MIIMTSRKGALWSAVAYCLLAFCGMAKAQSEPATNSPTVRDSVPYRSITVPYDTPMFEGKETGLSLVSMILPGNLSRVFVIDTGTTFSAISDETARALGFSPQPGAGPDGHPVVIDGKQADFVNIPSIKTVDSKLDLHGQFAVMDSAALRFMPGLPQMGGVIGINMLSQMSLLYDFSSHHLTLVLPARLSEDEVRALGFSGSGIPMTQTPDNGLWYVELSISHGKVSKRLKALVDTGAVQTYLTRRIADDLGLRPDGMHVQSSGFTGRVKARRASLDTLWIGDKNFSNLTVYYPDRDAAWPPPLLGVDVLSRFRVLMDFANRRMYLAPPVPPSVPVKPSAPDAPAAPAAPAPADGPGEK